MQFPSAMKITALTRQLVSAVIASFVASTAISLAAPYDLDIAAPVQIAGTDAASADFQNNILPSLGNLVSQNLSLGQAATSLNASPFDPANLTIPADSTVRSYFVGENAGYANMLGFSTTGSGPTSDGAKLIFPLAQSTAAWGSNERYGWAPLQPGDFVDIGTFTAGTKLDFFLLADGANGGSDVFSTDSSANADGLVHAMSLSSNGSPYLLMAFEDIRGESVSVFNDLVFAIQIIPTHATGLAAPEPTLAIGGLFATIAFIGIRRRR